MLELRKSTLNGRLENEVEDFVATLENEFAYNVKSIMITYFDYDTNNEVVHTFVMSDETSACVRFH